MSHAVVHRVMHGRGATHTKASGTLLHIQNLRSLRSLRSSPFGSLPFSRAEQAWLGGHASCLPLFTCPETAAFVTNRPRDKNANFHRRMHTTYVDLQYANFHRRMQYEAMSCFATSTRGSVLLYTTEETQSARHEIDRNAPPRVVFLTYVQVNKKSICNYSIEFEVVEVGGVVPGYELPLPSAETEYR